MKKQKIYCYVDETGQDTGGRLFIVSIVIIDAEWEELRKQLEDIERRSGKQAKKWKRTARGECRAYMEKVLKNPLLAGKLYYSIHRDTRNYASLTVSSLAKAITAHCSQPYTATIFVDGLLQTEQHRFSRELRRYRINAREVRGMDDETDVFIRLADALAGFVRDALAGDDLLQPLYAKAIKKRLIREV